MSSDSDEVRASAVWHFDGATRGSAIPLILLQYRPQALEPPKRARTLADALMANFRAAGWESPVLLFHGGHLATKARVTVAGALGTGDVKISAGRDVHYDGPLTRPPGWTESVRKAGSVGVLAGADPGLDDPTALKDLAQLAEQNKLLAAFGELKRQTTLAAKPPASPPLKGDC